MSVSCECCVLSGRGICDGPIPCPEESCGCLSLVSVVCCQVEVSATGLSSYRGVLPTAVRRYVIQKPLV
jgi:hypothetical protein